MIYNQIVTWTAFTILAMFRNKNPIKIYDDNLEEAELVRYLSNETCINLTEINLGWITSLKTFLNSYNFLKIETDSVNHFTEQEKFFILSASQSLVIFQMESDLQRIRLLENKAVQKKGHLPLRNPATILIFVKKNYKTSVL